MKGTLVKCIQELVTQKFGAEKWKEALSKAGMAEATFLPTEDIDDADFLNIMKAVGEVASLTAEQTAEAFGEYWSTVYAPRVYGAYFRGAQSARELLLKLDYILESITKSMKGARPPRFRYEREGNKLLIMHYQSNRGLMNLVPGLIRGVGKYYKENLEVSLEGTRIQVRFP